MKNEELKNKIKKKLFKECVKDEAHKTTKDIAHDTSDEGSTDGETTEEEIMSKPVRGSANSSKTKTAKPNPAPHMAN